MAQDGEEGIVEPWNNKTSQNSGTKRKKLTISKSRRDIQNSYAPKIDALERPLGDAEGTGLSARENARATPQLLRCRRRVTWSHTT